MSAVKKIENIVSGMNEFLDILTGIEVVVGIGYAAAKGEAGTSEAYGFLASSFSNALKQTQVTIGKLNGYKDELSSVLAELRG